MESLSLQEARERLSDVVKFKARNKNKFEVGITNDYSLFSFFDYNRNIKTSNLKSVMKSIQKRGLIMPILVTIDYKVIDGQHRFWALKELELPIHYVIAHDYIPNDVEEVNNVGVQWDIYSRVRNLAKHGDADCIRLLELYDIWSPTFSHGTINDAYNKAEEYSTSRIKNKVYSIDEELGNEVLSNALQIVEISRKAKHTKFIRALKSVMMHNKHFDIKILKSNAQKKKLNIYNSQTEIRNEIVEVYNYYTRADNKIE